MESIYSIKSTALTAFFQKLFYLTLKLLFFSIYRSFCMELKQLEAFVAVVDYNSFSEAARHLFLTQPTVSAHVASLEKELDTKLISRTTKKLHVTPQGYDLYDSAVSMLKIRIIFSMNLSALTNRLLNLGHPPFHLPMCFLKCSVPSVN